MTGYADLIARLATVADSYAADRAGINAWYEQQCAAAGESLAQADAQLAAAGAALATAQGAVEFTDAEAVRLWGLLAARMKVPVPALGVPPGEYQLEVWHEAAAKPTLERITVGAGGLHGLALRVGGEKHAPQFLPDKSGKPRQSHLGY